MKRIFFLLPLLLASIFYSNAQPTLYGVSGNGGGNSVLSKYVAGANTLTAAHTFEDMGANPQSGVIEGPGGKYYGIFNGGKYNNGFIYSYDPSTSVYSKPKEFNNNSPAYEGSNSSDLTLGPDGKLYGIMQWGGSSSYGVIYSFDPITNIYVKKKELTYADGGYASTSLYLSQDGNFYGIGQYGGANGNGAIFRFDPITSTYTVLYNLAVNDGRYSQGKLAHVGNKLFGSSSQGGLNNTGTIFSLDLVTNTYQKHVDFDAYVLPYTNVKGSYSYSGLTAGSNGKLYGTTNTGGLNSRGTFFSFDPTTLNFTKIRDFNYSDGANPQRSLLLASDNKIYGTTQSGGTFGYGVMFSYNSSTNAYQIVKNFDNTTGSGPSNLSETTAGKLISTSNSGGTFRAGVIFSFIPSTAVYTKLYDFNNPNGKEAYGTPTKGNDGKLYGVTAQGGLNNYGILYSFDPTTSSYTKLRDFDNTTGGNPRGSLFKASNGKLYGMTQQGGANGNGVIYSYDPATSTYAKLKDLNYSTGGYPQGNALIQATNGKLYGMTNSGGVSGNGVIFSFDPTTLLYTNIKDFNSTDGYNPYGSLVQAANGKLYGLTIYGGVNGNGVLFSFDPVTLAYAKIKDFDYYSNGGYPYGSLVIGSDNKLYGMTSTGYNGGTIFSCDPATNVFESLTQNNHNSNGSLYMASNSKFYATTQNFGNFSAGQVYSYNPTNNAITILQSFNYDNGFYPSVGSSFVEVGNCSSLPAVSISTNSPASSPICQGSSLTLSASGGTSYYWTGPNGFSSSQQSPTINNVNLTAAGLYSVQVSNGEGDCVTTKSVVVGINPKPTGSVSADGPSTFCPGGSVGLSASYNVNSQCIYSYNNNCSFTSSLCNDGYTYFSNSSFSKTLNTPVSVPASMQFNVYWTGYNSVIFKFYLNGNLIHSSNGASSTFNCTPTADGNYPSSFTVPQSSYAAYWNSNGSNTFKIGMTSGYCYLSGVTVNILNPPPVSYQWSPSTGLSNAAISNPIASPTSTTLYTVTATSLAGCSATQSITVTVKPRPDISISPAGPIEECTNETILLSSVIGENSGNITSYQWYKNGAVISGATTSTYNTNESGNYTVKATNDEGCYETSEEVVVIIKPVPVVTISPNSTVCSGTSIQLLASGGDSYSWTGPDGFTSSDQNPVINNSQVNHSGSYTVVVSNTHGCDENAITEILVEQSTIYYLDADDDGYGDPNTYLHLCTQPQGYVSNGDDCNDSDPNIYPGAFTDLSPTPVLDPSFGNDGIVTLGHNYGATFTASALQQDGKLIAYGYTPNLGVTRIGLLARYNPDGSLDNSFGDNGVASIDIFSVIGNTISLQSDGKIIVAGEKYISGQYRIVISRYLTNGVLDNSFGVNGSFIMNAAVGARPTSVVIQTDDRIVVGGRWNMKPVVLRLNSNGTLDNSFNSTGVISLNNQFEIASVSLQPDGKIIAAGTFEYQTPLIIRYNSDGTVDNSFNLTQGLFVGGITIAAALQPDGKILLLSQDFDYVYYTVHRINPNGSVDNSFASGAIFSETNINGNSIAIQPDGRILIGGSEGNRILLKRYNSNGSVDNSFADNGSSRIIVECNSGDINSLAISNNRIYGAGRANNISQGGVFAYKLQWELNCPGDKEVSADAGQCSAIVNEIDPGVYPLSLVNYTLSGATTGSGPGSASGLEFNSGTTTVTYTAVDDNTKSCSFTVTVNSNIIPTISISTTTSTICGHPDVHFTASASDQGASPLYQWKVNGVEVASGIQNSTDIANLQNGDLVTCSLISSIGCAIQNPVPSNSITITVIEPIQYFLDADEDGYGDPSALVLDCSQKQGYVLNDDDCNDSDPNIYPGVITDLSPTPVLDPSFGNSGIVTLGHNDGATFVASALQEDGKLIAYGYTTNLGITRIGLLARYNPDGSLDNSFGDNGVASIDIHASSEKTIEVQQDGKIVVCGVKYISGQYRIVISRYLTNGVLDNSFGVNGSFIMNAATGARPTSVVIQADDKIVVGGRWNMKPVVLRLNSNGTLDNSFNSTGVISLNNQNEISSVLLQPDGKIIAAGLIDYQSPLIIRYNSDGTVDNSFNLTQGQFAAGYTITAALQPDGKILLLSQDFDEGYYTVHRINPNGSIDNSFAGGAIFSETNINGNSIALQPDGRILIGGSEGNRILLKRYNSNGSVDNSFADNGSSRIIVECNSGFINSLTISNNRIYGAGRANNPSEGIVLAYNLQWELNCPGDEEVNTDAGQCSAIVNGIDPVVYPLSLVNYTLSGATTGSGPGSASGSEFNSGTTTVTYTAVDDNTKSCNFTVTVTDDEDPVVQTQDIIIYLNDNGTASITAYDINGGSYDNCSSFEELSIELNKVDFNCSDVGENTVILMVTDASGNSNTALATVSVVDNTAPSFTCPQNRNISLSNNCKLLVPDLISELAGNDNCGNVTFFQYPVAGTLIDAQHNMQYSVTITATDINDNSSTCEVILTAKDMSAPVITSCPANRNISLNSSCNLVVPDLVSELSGSDNCGIVTFAQDPAAGTIINAVHIGTYNVVITASDGNGNFATCSVILTAKDITAPIITSCPGSNTRCFVSSGIYIIPVLTATDNCTIPSVSYTISGATSRSGNGNNASGTFNPGNSTINWIVNDGNGNTSTCSSTVVIDKIDVSIPNTFAANINSSIGSPNTIYIGYGGSSITLSSQVTSSVSPNTFTYKWTIGSPGGPAIGTGPTFTASPTTTTVYYLSVKSANNCAPVYQVSKQINVVDIRCGTNKIYVCKYKNGSYTTNCVQATTNNINNLGAGSYLGPCTAQPITAKGENNEEVKPIESFNVNAYPNPSNSSFNIIIQTPDQKEKVQIRVININGQVIERRENLSARDLIKIGERYINGVYLLEITQGKKQKVIKLVKQ